MPRPCRIIVVGGGVAGLALANMFEKFDLDYVLLEAYEDIVAPAGAAIGLMPNGSFILDQLGCYEAIKTAAQDGELEDSHIRDSTGKSLMGLKYMMYHEEKRHGYPMLFFDRQWFLRVLYDQLKHKDRIQLRSRVDRIKSFEDGIRVTTKDGKCFTGDIVIGADGIHSIVRQEMRRIADATDPLYFETGEENKVPCYYQCSYGIAQHVDGWPGREQCFTAGHGKSFLVMSGPGNRCYWFLFVKLPVVRYGKQIPKYSDEDEARFVKSHAILKITENLTFGQVYAKRLTSTLTALHEIVYKKWFFDRIILIGDSAHKPNPIGGMGANAAIETAAEFVNALLDMKAQRQSSAQNLENLSPNEIRTIFQHTQDARFKRASTTVSSSHLLQALIAYEYPFLSTIALRALMPLGGQHNFFRGLSNRIAGGSRLKYIDLPERPRAIPYDHELPAEPLGVLPGCIAWGLFSFGMIMLIYTANSVMKFSGDTPRYWAPLSRNWLSNDKWKMPTSLPFTTMNTNLAPRLQLVYFLTHTISPVLIYTVEGHRIGRHGTLLSLPIIFTISIQYQGLAKITSLYALLSASQRAQNTVDRAVSIHVARALVPALILSFVIPIILMIGLQTDESMWYDWIQVSPLLFSILTAVFSSVLAWLCKPKSEEDTDRHPEWYSTDDVPILRFTYKFAFAVQATVHIAIITFTYFHPNPSLDNVFWVLRFSNSLEPQNLSTSLAEKIFFNLKYDLVFSVAAIVSHNLYSIWELRRQGYVLTSEALKVALAVSFGQVFVGSGATWAALWNWRESVVSGLSKSGI